MHELAQLFVNGLVTGAVLAMAAVGVTLVYGVLGVVNFAHGDYLTIGAYAAFVCNVTLGLSIVVATGAALLGVAVLGVLLEFALWRPMRRRRAGTYSVFITAIGLALVLRQVLLLVFGGTSRQFAVDAFGTHELLGIRLSTSQLVAVGIAAVANVAVGLLLARTSLGRSMRAYSESADLAGISGIDASRVVVWTWAIAGGLAGLAGVLQALVQTSFDPNMGYSLLLPVFAAVVLGSIGNAYGALLGGFTLGVLMQVSTWSGWFGGVPPVYMPVVAFVGLALVLLVRPQGLLSRVTA